jgi:hypothetical protein
MNLGKVQVLSPEVHGVLDYVTGATLLAAPKLFKFERAGGPAVTIPRMLGSLILGQAAITDYKAGLIKVLPFNLHLAMDYALGPFLALSPFLFGFHRRRRAAWLPHVLTGAFVTLTTLMTRPKPEWQRAEERLSRDVDQAIDYGRHIEADVERAVRDQMPAGTSLD